MPVKLEKWLEAQKKYRLSDKQIQMARELGLNPDKFGKLNNHQQEQWKVPLPQFIEDIYFKRFKRMEPTQVKSVRELIANEKSKKEMKKIAKQENRKLTGGVDVPLCEINSVFDDWLYAVG